MKRFLRSTTARALAVVPALLIMVGILTACSVRTSDSMDKMWQDVEGDRVYTCVLSNNELKCDSEEITYDE